MLRFLPALVVPSLLLAFGPTHASPARLLATRSAETPRGATRVVFETDRPVEYLAVELPSENGFEIHLLDVDGTTPPADHAVPHGLIRNVAFHGTAAGVVARLAGSPSRLTAHTFTLANPPRVVVDLRAVPDHVAASGPAVARKAGGVGMPDSPKVASAGSEAASAGTPGGTAKDVANSERAVPREEDFEDLLVWIHALQTSVQALNVSDSDVDRARYRRRLAYLLIQRGILLEGERALVSAVSGDGRDPMTAVADSVSLAEIRFRMGEREAAAETARNIPASRATPSERVRVAAVLLDTGNPTLAATLLRNTLDQVEGSDRARAVLLLARAHWDQNEIQPARDAVRRLTSAAGTPSALLPGAIMLHADCEFALGKPREAETLYLRAAALALSDEEASWVGLQLGNLARRGGRDDEARRHWQDTAEKWPDTFYASQAAWFLRVSNRMQKFTEAEAGRG